MSQKLLLNSEWMRFCTTRVETELYSGGSATGTGFFFMISQEENMQTNVMIANKHVLVGAKTSSIFLTRKDKNNNPIDAPPEKMTISNFEGYIANYPDPNVDLCAFILGPTMQMWAKKNSYYICINRF